MGLYGQTTPPRAACCVPAMTTNGRTDGRPNTRSSATALRALLGHTCGCLHFAQQRAGLPRMHYVLPAHAPTPKAPPPSFSARHRETDETGASPSTIPAASASAIIRQALSRIAVRYRAYAAPHGHLSGGGIKVVTAKCLPSELKRAITILPSAAASWARATPIYGACGGIVRAVYLGVQAADISTRRYKLMGLSTFRRRSLWRQNASPMARSAQSLCSEL